MPIPPRTDRPDLYDDFDIPSRPPGYKTGVEVPDRMKTMQRWSPEKLVEVKAYLETKPPETFTREDHYLVVEWLVQRYLPEDDQRTEGEYQKALAVLYERVDKNLDRIESGENLEPEPVEDDPDFAEWLKQTLSKKIDRGEILGMLSSFEQEGNERGQAHALRMFNFYLKNPDSFQIDDDLRMKMQAVVAQYQS